MWIGRFVLQYNATIGTDPELDDGMVPENVSVSISKLNSSVECRQDGKGVRTA
jgi:hypothetical protein